MTSTMSHAVYVFYVHALELLGSGGDKPFGLDKHISRSQPPLRGFDVFDAQFILLLSPRPV